MHGWASASSIFIQHELCHRLRLHAHKYLLFLAQSSQDTLVL